MEIMSKKDATSRGLSHYFTGKPCKYGHIVKRNKYGQCMECNRLKINTGRYKDGRKAYRKKYREENREALLASENAYREANPDRVRRYKQNDKKRLAKWKKDHPAKVYAKNRAYKLRKTGRTPPWADLEAIRFFYECCPAGCHVDHIIPLSGKRISGLHVAENLQWLPVNDNLRKSNSWK